MLASCRTSVRSDAFALHEALPRGAAGRPSVDEYPVRYRRRRTRGSLMVEFTAPGPSWNVEVGIGTGTPQYLTFVWAIYGHDAGPWWEALGDLLGGRPGWHCDFTNQGLLWSYGALGSSLFNISAPSAPDDSSEPSD